MRDRLMEALAEVMADHSVGSAHGMVQVLRRHVCRDDPDLDCALIRAQFIIASRRYLRAPRALFRTLVTEAYNEPSMRPHDPAQRFAPPEL